MTIEELNHILYDMTYMEYVIELQEKYGKPNKPYFYINKNGNWSNNKITRTNEGLFVHHVLENYFLQLSNKDMYIKQLELYKNDEKIYNLLLYSQTPDMLVYCDMIEHLILHMKIGLEYKRDQFDVGIHYITIDLVRFFDLGDKNQMEVVYNAPSHQWKCKVYYKIKDEYEIYKELCKVGVFQLNLPYEYFLVDWFGNIYMKLFKDIHNSLNEDDRQRFFHLK